MKSSLLQAPAPGISRWSADCMLSCGVREYWIIEPQKRRVYVYFFAESSAPEVYDFHTPVPVRIWEGKLSITAAELDT